MEHDRIKLYIQPAYNYNTKNIEYAEVLIREYRGIKSASKIIQFVEFNQMEESFDIDVLTETLYIIKQYGKLKYPIGINLCPNTIKIKGIANKIYSIINKNNTSNNEIVIEINEKTDFRDRIVRENIEILRENNIKIALDDFGIDGSNLYSLLSCNIDILKVDRAFIDNTHIEYEESQSKILRRLLQICNDFNLKHIVEGIETKKQLKNIENLGYSIVQGYLYERPLPIQEFLENDAVITV